MIAVDREVVLGKISSTGAADKSVTKLLLQYEWHEGDDCDFATYLCKTVPEVREAIRLADEDDARIVKLATNAHSRIGETLRHVTLWGCPYRQRHGVPAADETAAKLLDFPSAQIVGDLSFKIKGKSAKLLMTIQIQTAEMVSPNGQEIGLRSLYQLRGEKLWLDIEWADDAQEKLGFDPIAERAKAAAESVLRREEQRGQREGQRELLATLGSKSEDLDDPNQINEDSDLSLGLSRVGEDWTAAIVALVNHGGFQAAQAQQIVESVASGEIELIASGFGPGSQWALDLSNSLEAAGAQPHFVASNQTLESVVSEWSRSDAAEIQSVIPDGPSPVLDLTLFDMAALREMAANGDLPQLRKAMVALGDEDITVLQSYYTRITQGVTKSTKPDYIAGKFIAALKRPQSPG